MGPPICFPLPQLVECPKQIKGTSAEGRQYVVSTQIGMEFAASCPPIAKMMIVYVPPGLVLHVVPFFSALSKRGYAFFVYWFFCLFGGYVGMVGEFDAWEFTRGHVLSPLLLLVLVELGVFHSHGVIRLNTKQKGVQ